MDTTIPRHHIIVRLMTMDMIIQVPFHLHIHMITDTTMDMIIRPLSQLHMITGMTMDMIILRQFRLLAVLTTVIHQPTLTLIPLILQLITLTALQPVVALLVRLHPVINSRL